MAQTLFNLKERAMTNYPADFALEVHSSTHTVEIAGGLAQDTVSWVAAAVRQLSKCRPRVITIDGSRVDDVEAGALDELAELAEAMMAEGMQLLIANPSAQFRDGLLAGGCAALLARPARRAHRA